MINAFILARKDTASYFHTWLGFIIFIFFYLVAGIFFSFLMLSYSRISVEAARNAYEGVQGLQMAHFIFGSFFLNMSGMLLLLTPLLAMRAIAEERKFQTLELLFTYPLSDFDITLGKFLGLVNIFLLLLLPTAGFVFLFHYLGGQMDWGPIAMGYLGFFLLGCAYLALGLFISSLTENQVINTVITFAALVSLWALDWLANAVNPPWRQWLIGLSPLSHYRDFALGILDLSHVVYFCFFTLYFLFLTLRSIETRNWKG
ncbi:MAG TPA: ABC transporter permease [bacterium]|nr:ABC transporter permease [bacterium]